MADSLTIALAQVNPAVGDIAGNVALIKDVRAKAHAAGADLVVFPELTISGYPPEDLVYRVSFLEACERAVRELADLIDRRRRSRPDGFVAQKSLQVVPQVGRRLITRSGRTL